MFAFELSFFFKGREWYHLFVDPFVLVYEKLVELFRPREYLELSLPFI